MALSLFDKDLNIIAALEDEPNDVGGLGAAELKAKFDEAANIIKDYINKTLIPDIESDIDAAAQGVASGGGIDGSRLLNSSVGGEKLKDSTISANKIADKAVETSKLADKSVTRAKLADDALMVQPEDFANKVVPGRALADSAVSTVKLEDSAVTEEKIADNAVSDVFTATLSADGWSEVNGRWQQSAAMSQIEADDKLIADLSLAGLDTDGENAALEAWGNCVRIEVSAGSILAIFSEKPEVSIELQLLRLKK